MTGPLSVREGGTVLLSDLFESDTAPQRESVRRTIHRLGERLRHELGLREDAFVVIEGESGPLVRTRGVAGTITIGSRTLDIRPKHVDDDVTAPTTDVWQSVLALMIERTARHRASYTRSRRLQFRARTFLDQLAMGLAMELEDATRHAQVRAYVSRRQELGQVRGRLLVTEQLRSSLLKPHRVICEVDELSADNPINRLLHWAARELVALSTQPSVRRRLSEAADRLPSVTPPLSPPVQLGVQLPRQYLHYAGAVELALAFARGRTTVRGASRVNGAGYLIGTERLFESFIERSLVAALADSWDVRAQERAPFAYPVVSGRGHTFYSKPDNVLHRAGVPVLIVDAKYKRFEDATESTAGSAPTNGDLYQMAAACVAHDCARALLVYPRSGNQDLGATWDPTWWRVEFAGRQLSIGAVSVPLHLLADPGGLATFDQEFGRAIEDAAAANPPLEAVS